VLIRPICVATAAELAYCIACDVLGKPVDIMETARSRLIMEPCFLQAGSWSSYMSCGLAQDC